MSYLRYIILVLGFGILATVAALVVTAVVMFWWPLIEHSLSYWAART